MFDMFSFNQFVVLCESLPSRTVNNDLTSDIIELSGLEFKRSYVRPKLLVLFSASRAVDVNCGFYSRMKQLPRDSWFTMTIQHKSVRDLNFEVKLVLCC